MLHFRFVCSVDERWSGRVERRRASSSALSSCCPFFLIGLLTPMSQLASNIFARLQNIVHGSASTRAHLHSEMYINGFATIPFSAQDRCVLDKTYKLMDKVMSCCQSSRLNLKNSPPFILDILPDIFTQLIAIFTRDANLLAENVYIHLYVQNVQIRCKEVLKLFKTTNIFNDDSVERRHLTFLSLVFSHMLSELRAFFQEGEYVADKFRLTKKEADTFWKNAFKSKTIVPWMEFVAELSKAHPLTTEQRKRLKASVDLTCNDHVSMFEFDVFTRLFYPWKSLIDNWQLLTTHAGYVAFLTYDEVKKQLDRFIDKPGSYVFRLSCTRLGQWAIGYVAPDKKIYQTIPQNKSLIQALHEGSREGFYLFPNGENNDVDLTSAFEVPTADRVAVTSEQHEIYCEMGTTFELCKICDDNEKNVKLEPCGHLLCSACLSQWNDSEGGNTCPFCRDEIKGTARVVIDKFRSSPEKRLASLKKRHAPPPRETRETSALISFDDMPSSADSIPPSLAPPPLPPRNKREGSSSARSSIVHQPSSTSLSTSSSAPNIDAPPAPSQPPHSYVNVVDASRRSYVNADVIIQNESDRP